MPFPRPIFDNSNRLIDVAEKIGGGGEGTIYRIAGVTDACAKIYDLPGNPISKEKGEKLRAMLPLANAAILKTAAWPVATLHDGRGGPVIGFTMPMVRNGREIHTLYSPAHRKFEYPQADWRFLIHAAMNCAIAFDAVHRTGAVIGDVNQSNVFVRLDATVVLIDCDSFQVSRNGTTYRCEVGVPLFTPPELQNRSFSGITRTQDHDRFGLALLIFHLLYVGRHPFAGRYSGPNEMPIERAIGEFRFAYGSNAARLQMQPPLHTPPITIAPGAIVALFERAFSPMSVHSGCRPTGAEWVQALQKLLSQLQPCAADPGHTHLQGMIFCPWCELMKRGGPNYFIAVAFSRAGDGSSRAVYDIEAIWKKILALKSPQRQYSRPFSQAHSPRQIVSPIPGPLPKRVQVKPAPNQKIVKAAAIVCGGLALPSVFVLTALAVAFFITGVFLAIWWMLLEHARQEDDRQANRGWEKARSRRDEEMARLQDEFQQRRQANALANDDLGIAEERWQAINQRHDREFYAKYKELCSIKSDEGVLIERYKEELKVLNHSARDQQLHLHLQQHFISDQKIKGIGPSLLAALASYGIETADDIVAANVQQVPGFGDARTQTLLAWRSEVEGEFVFDYAKGVPPSAKLALDMKYQDIRRQFNLKLQTGLQELQLVRARADVELNQQTDFIRSVVSRVEQTKVDLEVFSDVF